ncbi:MAG: hypothetical protein EA428_11055 [Spirochaetaceae bacterium]|nr:MAG: hypothetical protein EA428_11055 [Spirochaetaceae bacterium]
MSARASTVLLHQAVGNLTFATERTHMIYRHTYTYKRGAVISALVILFAAALGSAVFLAQLHLVPHVVNRVVTNHLTTAADTYGLELRIGEIRYLGGYELHVSDLIARDRANGHYLEISSLTVTAGPGVWLRPRSSVRSVKIASTALHLHESATGLGLPTPQPPTADKPTLHQAGIFGDGVRAKTGTGDMDLRVYLSRGLRLLSNAKMPTLNLGELHLSFSSENEVPLFPWHQLRAEELLIGSNRVAGSFFFGPRGLHDGPSHIDLPETLTFDFTLGKGLLDTAGSVQFSPRTAVRIAHSTAGVPAALEFGLSGAGLTGTGEISLYDLAIASWSGDGTSTGNERSKPFFEVPELRISHTMDTAFSALADSLRERQPVADGAHSELGLAGRIDQALEFVTAVELSQPQARLHIDSQGRYRLTGADTVPPSGLAITGEAEARAPTQPATPEADESTSSHSGTDSQEFSHLARHLTAMPDLRVYDAELEVHDTRSRSEPHLSSTVRLSGVSLSFSRSSDITLLRSSGRVLSTGRSATHNGSSDGSWDIAFLQEGQQPPDIDLRIHLPNLTAVSQLFGRRLVDRVREGSFEAELTRVSPVGDAASLYAGHALLQSAKLSLPFLADEAFRLHDMSYNFRVSYDPEAGLPQARMLTTYLDTPDLSHTHGELLVEKGELRIAHVGMEFRPGLRGLFNNGGLPARGELSVQLPETELQTLLNLIPPPVLGAFAGTRLGGALSWEFDLEVPLERPSRMEWQSRFDAPDFNVTYLPDAVNVFKLAGSFEHTVVDPVLGFTTRIQIPAMQPVSNDWMRSNSGMTPEEVAAEPRRAAWFSRLPESRTVSRQPAGRARPTSSNANTYVRLEDMSHWIPRAVLSGEDSWFFAHRGFDWPAIKRAFELNLREGRVVVGASTISMQLMKNLYLNHDRVAARKLQEAFLVFLVEEVIELPKERMLELYLNIVEFGPEVFGIHQAARHYFGKTPAQLDVTEAVWLASILPSPKTYHRQFEHGEVFAWWLQRKEQYMASMVRRNRLSQEQYEAALGQKPRFRDSGT